MSRFLIVQLLVLEVLVTACGQDGGPVGGPGEGPAAEAREHVLYRWDPEPPGEKCQGGGTSIQSGVDFNLNAVLDSEEIKQTSYTCHGATSTEAVPGTLALLSLSPESPGVNCVYGGTLIRNGVDSNGNGTLEIEETAQTQFVCALAPPFPTQWAASSPSPIPTGAAPVGIWIPSGRKVTIFKTSSESRMKITVSDNLLTGGNANGGYGFYEVRMNGGRMTPGCFQGQYSWNAAGWSNVYHIPFSTVCMTDALPAGLYEFETWMHASLGSTAVGSAAPQALLLVEELAASASHGFSNSGGTFATASTVFQRAPGRAVSYRKQSADTLLRVTLADTLRTGYAINGGWGTVMVRLDGANTSCLAGKYTAQGTGGDFHDPFVLTCMLPGVSVGTHELSVWLRADYGDAYLGWQRSYPLLLVEEVGGQGMSYIGTASTSGELGGDWSGVGGRILVHNVSAAGKTLKLTYSDTFRSAVGCNASWGLYEVYVDGRPSSCSNGQYAYNAGSVQNHHRPINHVCLIKNLSPGPHTFSIWSTTRGSPTGPSCGTNYFGWSRGQALLLLEELP